MARYVLNTDGTAIWGNFTNNGVYTSDPSTQTFNNLTVGTTGCHPGHGREMYTRSAAISPTTAPKIALWNTAGAIIRLHRGTDLTHLRHPQGRIMGQTASGTRTISPGAPWTSPASGTDRLH